MEPDENRFGRVVSEFSFGFRDFAPYDHPSCQGIGLPLRDLSVALLSGEQERRPPVMGVDLSEVDAAVGGLLFPDLSNVAAPFEPDPCERRCLAEDGCHAASEFGATCEVL